MSSTAAQSAGQGGRAFKPGPRRLFLAGVVVALVVAGVLVLALKSGSGSSAAAKNQSYGSLPSWLPKSARDPGADTPKYEVATAARPVLDEQQGYTVTAKLPSGSTDVTAAGPLVPAYVSRYAQDGLWPATKQVPATFYVTFADVTGTVPIAASDFTVLTQSGAVVHPTSVTVRGGGKVPAAVKSGSTVTFEFHVRALAGQGAIRWAPGGPKVLVAWIFQLELD